MLLYTISIHYNSKLSNRATGSNFSNGSNLFDII